MSNFHIILFIYSSLLYRTIPEIDFSIFSETFSDRPVNQIPSFQKSYQRLLEEEYHKWKNLLERFTLDLNDCDYFS